ncbi:MAG: hypothetical protein RL220_686 [Bacteroidota bacterium]
MYYSSYLQLDKILNAQELESDKRNQHAHDEMLFIVIHQAYELWFKQVLFEVRSVHGILSQPEINDNSPELATINRRLTRVVEILKVLVHQIDILETMTPLDFLEFRDMLRPASGFQSMQFKELEAALGLRMEQRHGREYYTSQLTPDDKTRIEGLNAHQTILELVSAWLDRMPFDDHISVEGKDFWAAYGDVYGSTLQEGERENRKVYEQLFTDGGVLEGRVFTQSARRAALFITLYRDLPMLQNPYRLLNHLLEIDELLANWRWRHMNMVHRMVGMRMGTGGSSGKGYLREAAIKHYVFGEIAELTSFMVPRRLLPGLPEELESRLGFNG